MDIITRLFSGYYLAMQLRTKESNEKSKILVRQSEEERNARLLPMSDISDICRLACGI